MNYAVVRDAVKQVPMHYAIMEDAIREKEDYGTKSVTKKSLYFVSFQSGLYNQL